MSATQLTAPPGPARSVDDPPTVLYVAGMGRSGSTLLEKLLHRVPGVVGVGEVTHLWQRGLLDRQRCGCGTPLPDCGFWHDVLDDAGLSASDAERLRSLQQRVDRERHLLWLDRWWASSTRREDALAYRDVLRGLYRSVARVADAEVVVDTSKEPSTAAVLARTAGLRLRLVHLVRDPRAVAHSWTRRVERPEITTHRETMPTWSPSRSASRWLRENLLVETLIRQHPHSHRISYEDLSRNPIPVLSQLCLELGVPVPFDLAAELAEGTFLPQTAHTVAGNPLRFANHPIRVREDDDWHRSLPRQDARTVRLLTAPLAARYGYPRTLAPSAPATTPPPEEQLPSVSVIVPTRDRIPLAREAINAALAQRYDGVVECLLVFDQSRPDHGLEADLGDRRRVRVLKNHRRPGLAGARNTGILAATGQLVAFCDDDDWWDGDKLIRQIQRLRPIGQADVVGTSTVIHHDGRRHLRRWQRPTLSQADLVSSRVQEVHPSSLLIHRDAFETIGLVDEDLPASYGEDRDWLLRAASVRPVEVVEDPLVHARWHRSSFFAEHHDAIVDAIEYLLDKHPALATDRRGERRLRARQAFHRAAAGRRRDGVLQALSVLRHDPLERRALAALLVGSGVVSAGTLQRLAQRAGRGI